MRSLPEIRMPRRGAVAALVAGVLLAATLLPGGAEASTACAREPSLARPAAARQLASAALREHAAMGGQTIDAGGGLIVQGVAEAERDHTHDTGEPAWQRVLTYWHAVPGLYLPWLELTGSEAELRTALVDRAWSAAFISHLMRRAGLGGDQFVHSASHHDYVRAAIQAAEDEAAGAATRYAYRACDLAGTPPRIGDLLCFARGASGQLDTFVAVRAAVRAGPVQMHCDLVVGHTTAWLDAVGGNVVQSVTLRRLALTSDGSGLLWPAYLEAEHRRQRAAAERPPAPGTAQSRLPQTHLNQQPWSVLLQLRSAAFAPADAPDRD